MAIRSLSPIAGAALLFSSLVSALDSQLVGTWSTKSGKVLTGPSFYNPVNDSLIEPSHTGISYSFTSDGYYEESYYRAVSNPTSPKCPEAIMQWQHGYVTENSDGSLTLTPIGVDGRQLWSNPCEYDNGIYTRYNQSETMKKWQVYEDGYYKVTRLDLYQYDGSLLQPLYLAYSPPVMLPTITMNPTTSGASSTSTAKVKRGEGEDDYEDIIVPMNRNAKHIKRETTPLTTKRQSPVEASTVFWAAIGMIIFGGTAYMM